MRSKSCNEFKLVFTSEFRSRLYRLYQVLGDSLLSDSPCGSLWPCLFSVYSFMWCSGFSRCTKKVRKF